MKCQMLGCDNKATVWSRYNGDDDWAMCNDCNDKSKKYSENPELCEDRPLTPEVEKLLTEMGERND